jgi:hypothetical protein
MVIGTPLNRLTSRRQRAFGLKLAVDAMEPLYQSTARQIGIDEYAADLVSRIAAIAESCEAVGSAEPQPLARLLGVGHGRANRKVELVRSHGDFQPGNILYNQGAIWLIDWEYSKERQRQYDFLTYILEARFAKGLGQRIAEYADAFADFFQLRLLQLFLLETILFECEAGIVAPSHYALKSLIALLAEFKMALPFVLRDCKA